MPYSKNLFFQIFIQVNRNSHAGLGHGTVLRLKVRKSKWNSSVASGQTEKDTLWLFLFLRVVFALQMKKESGIAMMLLTKLLLDVPRFPPSSLDAAPQWG